MRNRFICLIGCVFVLSGCNHYYDEITGESFKNEIKNAQIGDIADTKDHYDYASEAYQVVNDDIYIEYIFFNRGMDASGTIVDEVKNIYSLYDEDKITTYKDDGENYVIYKITTDDKYFCVLTVGRTYMYMVSDLENKNIINKLVNELI